MNHEMQDSVLASMRTVTVNLECHVPMGTHDMNPNESSDSGGRKGVAINWDRSNAEFPRGRVCNRCGDRETRGLHLQLS